MKRITEWLAIGLCAAAVVVFVIFFEAHFANEEGQYLFVYTADFLGRFWPFGEWHYSGVPVLNGSGAYFLHVFLTQFYYATAGIYAVLMAAFALWLWGWNIYARRVGIGAVWRSAAVYPLATALFLFAAISPKFPVGFLWGLLVALWLCVWSSRGHRQDSDGQGRQSNRTWRAYLSAAFILASMGFFPFLLFVVSYSILFWTKAHRPLWFAVLALYWLCLPFAWAAASGQSLKEACNSIVLSRWKNNGISKDWKLYNCYQKTWRALRQNNYPEALKQANRYWLSERAGGEINNPIDFTRGEQYFRRQLAECTKLALLMNGELNNRFLTYSLFPEMAYLFQPSTPMVSFYNPVYMRFYWETGHLTACAYEGVNIIERDGLRGDVLPLLALSQVCLEQYGLADKYLYLLKHTLFYRKEAEKIALLNRPFDEESVESAAWIHADPHLRALIQRKRADLSPLPIGGQSKEPQSEISSLFSLHPHNLYAAEYVLMKNLLSKNLPAVYEVLKHYSDLGYRKEELPFYAQEALLLFIEYGYRAEANEVIRTGLKGLETFSFNPGIVQRFEHFLNDKYALETGRMASNEFFEQYGHTYAFFFAFMAIFEDKSSLMVNSSPH